jgi:hypothetical protein
MSRILLAVLGLLAFCATATAADYDLAPRASRVYQTEAYVDICHVQRCGPRGCGVINLCRCPHYYSCYGLYDAYGPYGGRSFLSVYTRY